MRSSVQGSVLGSREAWVRGWRYGFAVGRVFVWRVSRWSAVPREVHELLNVSGAEDLVREAAREVTCYMLRKSDMPLPRAMTAVNLPADDLAQAYPILWAFLTQDVWEDGNRRELGSLLLFAQDNTLKGMVRDKERGCCLWVSAPGLRLLFETIENGLLNPGAEWRVDRVTAGTRASRVRGK